MPKTDPNAIGAPSRRSFITRAAAMTAGVAIGATAPVPSLPAPSDALAALIARVEDAKAVERVACDRVEAALVTMWERYPRPEILRVHREPVEVLERLKTSEDFFQAGLTAGRKKPDQPDAASWLASVSCCEREIAKIRAQRAEIELYLEHVAETRRALSIADLEEQRQASINEWNAAEDAVLAFPAHTVADCLAKLQFGARSLVFDGQSLDAVNFVIADLVRLGGGRKDACGND
jgi:hypothetical protein